MARLEGSKNKRSLDIQERMEKAKCDPLQVLMDVAKDNNHFKQIDAAKELLGYIYAKKKAIEITGGLSPEMVEMAAIMKSLPREDLLRIIEEELAKKK